MHFSTKEKNYGGMQTSGRTGAETAAQESVTNVNRQSQSTLPIKIQDRRQGGEVRRVSGMEAPKNEQLFESFPQLNIHRVDSAEHREKLKSNQQATGGYQAMTTSLISKPYNRGDGKLTSTSVDKTGGNYLNARENFSSNQSDTNKASYKLNYATYKKETGSNNLVPNYTYGANSDDGSDNNDVPSYKRITGVMTMERMDMEISPKMVSSVISRESSSKDGNEDRGNQRVYLSTSSRNKDQNQGGEQAYELFASRHPNESIRRSTIEISKAISSNAITELQRTNENQQKKIKKMQRELQQFKNSLKKWDQIKHRYQMDLESKSRQIFDLQRVNKRLTQQVQGIRAYRTMETVEQVIIVRLKQEIMQLNKKIIQMQAEHYKNQKSLLEKQNKKDSSKGEVQTEKEAIKKLQQATFTSKKQIQLLGIELQKEKQKSWNLQREKEEYEAGKALDRQNFEREISGNKKQILALRQEVQKNVEAIRMKDIEFQGVRSKSDQEIKKLNERLTKQIEDHKKALDNQNSSVGSQVQKLQEQLAEKQKSLNQRIQEQRRNFDRVLGERLSQKQAECRANFNNELRSLESLSNNKSNAEVQRLNAQLQQKDRLLEQRLAEQKRNFDKEMADKLSQKEQEYKVTLNNEMRLFELKIVEQGKNQKLKESQQKQMLDRLRAEKDQSQNQLKKKIAEVEDSLRATNQRLAQKDEQIKTIQSKDKGIEQMSGQFKAEIQHLRSSLVKSENYIVQLQNQNQNIKNAMREREIEIDHLKVDNLKIIEDIKRQINEKSKWKQEETFIIENQVKVKLQEEFKKKEKELEAKTTAVNTLEASVKQMKAKLEQDQQKVQAEARQKDLQTIKELEGTKFKLSDQVRKLQSSLQNLNKEVAAATTKKSQVDSQFSLKQREIKEIEVQINQFKTQLQTKLTQLSQAESQKKSILTEAQRLKQTEEKQKTSSKQLEVRLKQMESKYNSSVSELNNFKIQFGKLEQKCRHAQIETNRATQNLHTWKSKSQVLENLSNKLKGELSTMEKQREQLLVKAKDAEQNKGKSEIVKKYSQLLPEYQLLQQRLKIKQEQLTNRETAYVKVRQHSESCEVKANNLVKEVRNLSNKLDQTESKLKTILAKTQAEQYKYKQLYEKMVTDSQVYMDFIKKLQEDNQLVAQKYWKIRKLVKKQKINDDNDLLEKHDYATYRQFLEHQILTHFSKMIIPAFQAKILQKIAACETSISQKGKRLAAVKSLAEYVKRKRQAEKAARLKN